MSLKPIWVKQYPFFSLFLSPICFLSSFLSIHSKKKIPQQQGYIHRGQIQAHQNITLTAYYDAKIGAQLRPAPHHRRWSAPSRYKKGEIIVNHLLTQTHPAIVLITFDIPKSSSGVIPVVI